jgi:hypothetical protein
LKLIPWLLAFVGLGLPLAAAGGAGWPYVVFWLILLATLWLMQPLVDASHRLRIQSAAICTVLLVFPGWVVGGPYLLPAALAWLAIELLALRDAATPT